MYPFSSLSLQVLPNEFPYYIIWFNSSFRDLVNMLVFVTKVSVVYPLEAVVIISSASKNAMRKNLNKKPLRRISEELWLPRRIR